ncbi:MAG: hypothetical protein Q8M03_15310 [Legionella sp.]|nr:hypothetical protein [Legionella sp.]
MHSIEHDKREADNDVSQSLPVTNLLDTFKILATNSFELTHISAEILKRPKDKHGNVLIGIDDTNFTMWEKILKKIVPTKIFGPIVIPTNPDVIKRILSMHKYGEDAPFEGNRSTEVISALVGGDNPFAPTNKATHTRHKQVFKNHISGDGNIKKAGLIITDWISKYSKPDNIINEDTVSSLCARVLIAFLLSPDSVGKETEDAVIAIKTYFSAKVTAHFSKASAYDKAENLLTEEISRLYNSSDEEAYPVVLSKKGMKEEEVRSHILSLFMVGFGNLHSSVMSILIRIADNPQYRDELSDSVQLIDGFPFVQFKPASGESLFPQRFFEEAGRLTPAVWTIVRRNRKKELFIRYEEEGESKEMILPSSSHILIPNLHLARAIENGDKFNPDRPMEDLKNIPQFFSEGKNACPGRNIGYTTNGLLVGGILSEGMTIKLANRPHHVTGTALSWQANLVLNATDLVEKRNYTKTHASPTFFQKEKLILSLGVGTAMSLMVFLMTHNLSASIALGLTSAFLAMAFLTQFEHRDKIQFESLNSQF